VIGGLKNKSFLFGGLNYYSYLCYMNKVSYYKSPDDVILLYPIHRIFAKLFGKESMITRCNSCKKIPTEIVEGKYCLKCYLEKDKIC